MRPYATILFGATLFVAPFDGAAAQDGNGAAAPNAAATLKERLSDKASDPQRVNDCKVPPEKRGDSRRPADCGPAVGDTATGRSR